MSLTKTSSIVCDPGKAPTKPLPTVKQNRPMPRVMSPRQQTVKLHEQQAQAAEMLKKAREQNTGPEVNLQGLDKSRVEKLVLEHIGDGSSLFKRASPSLLDGIYQPMPVEHGATLAASRIKVAMTAGRRGWTQALEGEWLGHPANITVDAQMAHGRGAEGVGQRVVKVAVALPQQANSPMTLNAQSQTGGAPLNSAATNAGPEPQEALAQMGAFANAGPALPGTAAAGQNPNMPFTTMPGKKRILPTKTMLGNGPLTNSVALHSPKTSLAKTAGLGSAVRKIGGKLLGGGADAAKAMPPRPAAALAKPAAKPAMQLPSTGSATERYIPPNYKPSPLKQVARPAAPKPLAPRPAAPTQPDASGNAGYLPDMLRGKPPQVAPEPLMSDFPGGRMRSVPKPAPRQPSVDPNPTMTAEQVQAALGRKPPVQQAMAAGRTPHPADVAVNPGASPARLQAMAAQREAGNVPGKYDFRADWLHKNVPNPDPRQYAAGANAGMPEGGTPAMPNIHGLYQQEQDMRMLLDDF